MLQHIPSWIVTWNVTVHNTESGYIEQTDSETTMRVPRDNLVAFIQTLDHNNVREFHVKQESFN